MFPGRREGPDGASRGARRPGPSHTEAEGGDSSRTAQWEAVSQERVLVHISLPSSSSSTVVSTSRRECGRGSEQAPGQGDSRHREPESGRNVRRSGRCAPVSMRRWVCCVAIDL